MLSKGINPHVISGKMFGHDGKSVAEDWPSSFKSEEAKHLMDQFPRSINFSVEDINCNNTCPVDCESKYQRFYFKNGTVVKMSEENKIGQGGFGSVFKGVFHGQNKAMKCVLIGEIEYLNQACESSARKKYIRNSNPNGISWFGSDRSRSICSSTNSRTKR